MYTNACPSHFYFFVVIPKWLQKNSNGQWITWKEVTQWEEDVTILDLLLLRDVNDNVDDKWERRTPSVVCSQRSNM